MDCSGPRIRYDRCGDDATKGYAVEEPLIVDHLSRQVGVDNETSVRLDTGEIVPIGTCHE